MAHCAPPPFGQCPNMSRFSSGIASLSGIVYVDNRPRYNLVCPLGPGVMGCHPGGCHRGRETNNDVIFSFGRFNQDRFCVALLNIFGTWWTGTLKPRKKKFFSSFFLVFFGFRSFLTVFLPPLPEVGCPIFLEIRNPWEKVMERSGLRYEHFCLKIASNRRAIFFCFLYFFRSSSVFGLF